MYVVSNLIVHVMCFRRDYCRMYNVFKDPESLCRVMQTFFVLLRARTPELCYATWAIASLILADQPMKRNKILLLGE